MRFYQQIILAVFIGSALMIPQSKVDIERAIVTSSLEFRIPVDLLKAVAYAESRWTHHIPEVTLRSTDDAPHSYGVMGLRDDEWFGHSAKIGADLIGSEVATVINDYRANIRAAAAYLRFLADRDKYLTNDLNTWKKVLEQYSGIPQENVREFYSFDVFKALKDGVEFEAVIIPPHQEINLSVFDEEINPANKLKNIESDDYPAAVWSASPNYTSGSLTQRFALVHTTEGGFAGSVSWLQNPQAQASAHYVIRSSDGYIVQLVREADKAWHAVCWNGYMLGVEHEAFVENPAYFTDAMYISSAALFRHFCTKFTIPYDRNRIIGHNEWKNPSWTAWMASNYPSISTTCNTHTDPGQYWDWAFYMQLVSQDTTSPSIVGATPLNNQDSVYANQKIKITFNQRMKRTEAQAAFSITPQVQGTFTWENSGRTMVFSPAPTYQTNTQYTVQVNAAAVNYNNRPLLGGIQFTFHTAAVMPLIAVSNYPANGATGISPSVRMMVTFNTPLLQSSIGTNVELRDASNNLVALKPIVYQENNYQGRLVISAQNRLVSGAVYQLTVKSQIQNVTGSALGTPYTTNFTITAAPQSVSNVLDNFDAIGNWKDPNYSGSTVGTDPNATTFEIVTDDAFSGSSAGKISYLFTDLNGVCRTFNGTKPSVGSSLTTYAGLWVNGDYSKNLLEYWFYYNSTTNVIQPVDTLNWTGWKLVEIPISAIGGTGDRLFHSVVIRRTAQGAASGAVYIDALQTRVPTGVGSQSSRFVPTSLLLEQNYPNPFNPSTSIRFELPKEEYVSLTVFNSLGQEVAILLSEVMKPGIYSARFDASVYSNGAASGTYYYQLRAGLQIITKKMIYLR